MLAGKIISHIKRHVYFNYLLSLYPKYHNPETLTVHPVEAKTVTAKRTAIQIHVFYTDIMEEICSHLKNLTISYDLYISTVDEDKKAEIQKILDGKKLNYGRCRIEVIENRGRDIYPFLKQIHPVYEQYDVICHLHTKKSRTVDFGDYWRQFIYDSIFGSGSYADALFSAVAESDDIGFASPMPIKEIWNLYMYNKANKRNQKNVQDLLNLLGINITLEKNTKYDPMKIDFPAGNMFVAKTDAVRQLLSHDFKAEDFPDELGQVEDTLQHTVELVWQYLVNYNGYRYVEIQKNGDGQ